MRNRPPGISTIPSVAVFTTYVPLATTSPKDPFCPRLLHSAGAGTRRRWDGSSAEENIVDAFLQAQSREPSQRDSSSDSNAVISAGIHRAPFVPSRAYERPLRRLRWLLLISG